VIEGLAPYARIRDRHLPHPSNRTFFVSNTGTPVIYGAFGTVFRKLLLASGVGADSAVHPRIHDYADLRVVPTYGERCSWSR
jgi:hypothetical protein